MDFLDIFSAQNDCLVIGYLMGTEIFGFWSYLCLSWLFKQGTRKGRFCYLLGGLLFVDFTLACCQPVVVINRKYTH